MKREQPTDEDRMKVTPIGVMFVKKFSVSVEGFTHSA